MKSYEIQADTALWNKNNYTLDLPYMIGRITEYDLSKANISALLYTNKITKDQYDYIYNLPKYSREIYIGNMIKKNKDIWTNGIKAGIIEAKRLFFNINSIIDNEVLSIKNDAIFIFGTRPIITNINEYFTFNIKGVYDLFIKTKYLELYYGYDLINNNDILDIKGINDNLLYKHTPFINFLKVLFYKITRNNIKDAIDYYNGFYEAYINKNLPIEYYREFNSNGKYRMYTKYAIYYIDILNEDDKDMVLIDYNISILRNIYSILMNIYFNK